MNAVTDVDELHLLKTFRSSADRNLITVYCNRRSSSHQDSILRLRTMTNGCCLAQRPCGVTYHIVYQMRFHGLTSDNFRLVRAEKPSVGCTTSHQSVRSMQMQCQTSSNKFESCYSLNCFKISSPRGQTMPDQPWGA